MMIESIKDLQKLVVEDPGRDWKQFGDVAVKSNGDLLLFNYTPAAQYAGRWNYFERVSRGLIVNAITGEVVARPFDKFFHWNEGGRTTSAKLKTVTEKADGSLGISYRDDGQFYIATRGRFDSDQALWATDYLNTCHPNLDIPEYITLLFEIIYPENRIIVDYGDTETLILLAMRNRHTGSYWSYKAMRRYAFNQGFRIPVSYRFTSVLLIMSKARQIPSSREGWVAEFWDGQRFKFKGDEYLKLHKLVYGLSFKNTLTAVRDGKVDEIRAAIPDEFLGEFETWVNQINDTVWEVEDITEHLFDKAPKEDRKTFAQWVTGEHKHLAPYLFALYDGRDIRPLIYKLEFKNGS